MATARLAQGLYKVGGLAANEGLDGARQAMELSKTERHKRRSSIQDEERRIYVGKEFEISAFHIAGRLVISIPNVIRSKVERKNGSQRREQLVLLGLVFQNLRLRIPGWRKRKPDYLQNIERIVI